MKKLIMISLVSFVTLLGGLNAALAAKNNCGLPDGFDSDTYEDVGEMKSLVPGVKLNKIEKAQAVITARSEANSIQDDVKIASAVDAVKYLSESSEGGDAYIGQQQTNDTVYDVVLYYPGGNPVGVIFVKGTTEVKGYIEDSSVVCH
jgi:hypothetical protein